MHSKGSLKSYTSFTFGLSDIDIEVIIKQWSDFQEYKNNFDKVNEVVQYWKKFWPMIDCDVTCKEMVANHKIVFTHKDDLFKKYRYFYKLYFLRSMHLRNQKEDSLASSFYTKARLKRTTTKLEKCVEDLHLYSNPPPLNAGSCHYDGDILYFENMAHIAFAGIFEFKKNTSVIKRDQFKEVYAIQNKELLWYLYLGVIEDKATNHLESKDIENEINRFKVFHRQQVLAGSKEPFSCDLAVKYLVSQD